MQTLPQLESSTYSGQIFWLIISFTVLYFTIDKVFLPKITDILDKRSKYIDEIKIKIQVLIDKINQQQKINQDLKYNSKNQINEILKNARLQSDQIQLDNQSEIEGNIRKLNNELSAELKTQFEYKKPEIYSQYIQISSDLFSNILGQELQNNINNAELEANFEQYWLKQKNNI